METKLLVLKPAKIFGDPNGLANFRFANGRGFPASYQRFATQYGWDWTVTRLKVSCL